MKITNSHLNETDVINTYNRQYGFFVLDSDAVEVLENGVTYDIPADNGELFVYFETDNDNAQNTIHVRDINTGETKEITLQQWGGGDDAWDEYERPLNDVTKQNVSEGKLVSNSLAPAEKKVETEFVTEQPKEQVMAKQEHNNIVPIVSIVSILIIVGALIIAEFKK